MSEYFNNLNNLPNNKVIKEMRKYAISNKIPIINDESLTYILHLAEMKKPKRFLEIGTAIGFCSINLACANSDILIDTIEKSEEMYQEALKNVKNAKLENRINIHLADALEFDTEKLDYKYDLIFIDAAKAQYIKFFEKYQGFLAEDGLIISDNLLFHGLVAQDKKIENKNLRSLVEKIREYNLWLSKLKTFSTTFLDLGDGIAISKKVKK